MSDGAVSNYGAMTAAHQKKLEEIKACNDEEKSKLRKELKKADTFGAFCICAYHPATGDGILVKLSALLVLLAQVVMPLLVAIQTMNRADHPWCPVTGSGIAPAPALEKMLLASIALMYAARLFMLFQSRHANYTSDDKRIRVWYLRDGHKLCLYHELSRSGMNWVGQVDDFMATTYEALIYLLNLWLVSRTRGALDKLLNALALEFVMKLDEEFKEVYCKTSLKALVEARFHMAETSEKIAQAVMFQEDIKKAGNDPNRSENDEQDVYETTSLYVAASESARPLSSALAPVEELCRYTRPFYECLAQFNGAAIPYTKFVMPGLALVMGAWGASCN